ncbi:MAG: hypothetical protein AB4206_18260 [Xenococcaceae cyanobacterium]
MKNHLNSLQFASFSPRQKTKNTALNRGKNIFLNTVIFFLATSMTFAPGFLARAAMIIGLIESYDSQSKQATINLGKKDGLGKYDRGKIEFTSLDDPNVRFIGANIVVLSVKENSAVVSVREAPGVQIPVQAGARVTVDTESGLARREEEARLIAIEQAKKAQQQQQIEQARQQQRELEQARAAQARQQRELEQARAAQAQQQREPEQQNDQTQSKPKVVDIEEARNFWKTASQADIQVGGPTSDLPSDYLQAYVQARTKPSPETYYKFAQILIDYEITDKALMWLREAESRFPLTKSVNNFYEALALTENNYFQQSLALLRRSGLSDHQLLEETRSYILTQNGNWQEVIDLSAKKQSAVISNNYLIALYCYQPQQLNQNTSLILSGCPSSYQEPLQKSKSSHEEYLNNLKAATKEAKARYPNNPYIINTIGFLALKTENYALAYQNYQQLAKLLDSYSSTPPHLQMLKANAINYINNYNQNYEFMASRSENLDLLRSQQNSLTKWIAFDGIRDVARRIDYKASTNSIVAGVLATLMRVNESRIQARRIADERRALRRQIQRTFTKDINLVSARPNLEPKSLLESASGKIQKQILLYDSFWNCHCPSPQNSDAVIEQGLSGFSDSCNRSCNNHPRKINEFPLNSL